MYFDAHVLGIERRVHDIRGCRCQFLVTYDHDDSQVVTDYIFTVMLFVMFRMLGSDIFPPTFWTMNLLCQEKVNLKRLCRRPKPFIL